MARALKWLSQAHVKSRSNSLPPPWSSDKRKIEAWLGTSSIQWCSPRFKSQMEYGSTKSVSLSMYAVNDCRSANISWHTLMDYVTARGLESLAGYVYWKVSDGAAHVVSSTLPQQTSSSNQHMEEVLWQVNLEQTRAFCWLKHSMCSKFAPTELMLHCVTLMRIGFTDGDTVICLLLQCPFWHCCWC